MSTDTTRNPASRHAYERGVVLDIYQNPSGNFSNAGVSARVTQLTVTRILDRTGDPGAEAVRPLPADCRVFAPTEDRPEAVLVLRKIGHVLLHVSPLDAGVNRGQPMMGGCYVATSDSRWSRVVEAELGHPFYGALALHDRWEG